MKIFTTIYPDMGTSIQVGEGDGMYRMHIHVPTEKRYEPIDYIMSLGTMTKVAMENLLAQMDRTRKQHPTQTPIRSGRTRADCRRCGLTWPGDLTDFCQPGRRRSR